MRYAGEELEGLQIDPVPVYIPSSPPDISEGGPESLRFQRELAAPAPPTIDPSELEMTPELTPRRPFNDPFFEEYIRDRYIQNDPRSGITMLPNGEQGPAQGPNTPIKQYENGQYMPYAAEYPADEMIAGFFNPLDWFRGKNQSDIEKIKSGSDEPIEGHGSHGTPLMNSIRKRNRMLDQI